MISRRTATNLFRAAVSAAPYLVAGVLVATMATLLVRDDLVADAIARGLAPSGRPRPRKADVAATAVVAEWTAAAAELTGVGVPPAVWFQALVNRVQKFQADRMEPLEKRLEVVRLRLENTGRATLRARTAYR